MKLEVAQGSLRTMKNSLQLDIERLKKNVESLKEDVARKRIIREGRLLGCTSEQTEDNEVAFSLT